jgi:hypothetical protein
MYWWLLATNDDIILENDPVNGLVRIRAIDGVYSGAILAADDPSLPGTSVQFLSTFIGRQFAVNEIGGRPINPTELDRALAGNYGFNSVSYDSIVRESLVPTSYLQSSHGAVTRDEDIAFTFSGTNPVLLEASSWNAFYVLSDGSLWGQGYNGNGNFGLGNTLNTYPRSRSRLQRPCNPWLAEITIPISSKQTVPCGEWVQTTLVGM